VAFGLARAVRAEARRPAAEVSPARLEDPSRFLWKLKMA
jgi:hypothetical protein